MAPREIDVTGNLFVKKGIAGDFVWMMQQPAYDDTLFVIAENFLDSLRDDAPRGGGTAVLRHFCPQRLGQGVTPRAVGVPTGWSTAAMGFPLMDTDVKRAIDLSLDRIALVLDQNPRFKRLMYSCDEQHTQLIGVKIFARTLSLSVREYISQALHSMDVWAAGYTSLGSIRRQELKLLRHALLVTEYHISQLPVKFRNAPQSTGVKRPLTAGKFQSLKHQGPHAT